MNLVGTYQRNHDQVIVCSELGGRYPAGIEPEEDGNGCNDHNHGDYSDELTSPTLDKSWYCGDAKVASS